MEAWVGGTPVLAYDACEVTAHHVRTSEGGLLYDDPTSFEVALSLLLEQPELREQMGGNGRRYVLDALPMGRRDRPLVVVASRSGRSRMQSGSEPVR